MNSLQPTVTHPSLPPILCQLLLPHLLIPVSLHPLFTFHELLLCHFVSFPSLLLALYHYTYTVSFSCSFLTHLFLPLPLFLLPVFLSFLTFLPFSPAELSPYSFSFFNSLLLPHSFPSYYPFHTISTSFLSTFFPPLLHTPFLSCFFSLFPFLPSILDFLLLSPLLSFLLPSFSLF